MNWWIILAVIIVIILAYLLYKKKQLQRIYAKSRFGYFVNQENLGAIFPQTGEPLVLTEISGRSIITALDEKTRVLAPKPFPEFGGRFIIVPGLLYDTKDVSSQELILYACATADEVIDNATSSRVYATTDEDTKLATIKLGDPTSPSATWKFTPVAMGRMDRARKLFGFAAHNKSSVFAEMPAKFPSWAASNTAFTTALKNGTFKGYLTNLKYPTLQYPTAQVTIKRWGNVGLIFVHESSTSVDPQILLVPTSKDMIFRVFSLQTAIANKETGKLENYTQLVATSGVTFELSKTIIDADNSSWTLVLA